MEKKHYFNKISENICIKDDFYKNHSIYNIKITDEQYAINMLNVLEQIKDKILAIFYESSRNIFLLFKKENDTNVDIIKNILKNHVKADVYKSSFIENYVILNLLLFNNSSKISFSDEIIVNYAYLHIIKTTSKQVEALNFRFNKNLEIEMKLDTYSKLSTLSEFDKKKNRALYIIGGKTLIRIYDKSLHQEDDIYVRKQIYSTHSHENSLNLKTYDEKTKLAVLGQIYELLKNNEYLENFEFDNVILNSYCNEKLFKSIQNYEKEFFKTHKLNIVYEKSLELDDEIYKKLNYYQSIKKSKEDLNLIVFDFTKNGEKKSLDEEYLRDYKSNLIFQHINIDNINNKTIITTCLFELIIKYELSNGNLKMFNWKEIIGKTYSFYIATKDDNENIRYSKITIDKEGCITERIIESEEEIDDFCDSLNNDDLGMIVDEEENCIVIRNTKKFIVPNYTEYLKEVKSVEAGRNKIFTSSEFIELLSEILDENPDLEEKIDLLLKYNPNINLDNEVKFKITDIVNEKGKHSINKTLKKAINEVIKEKYNTTIISHYKGENIDIFYPGFVGLNYNKNEYIAAYDLKDPQGIENNILFKDIDVLCGENFFEEILPLFFVPFVRNNRLTVLPFPFKYLRELIKHKKISEERLCNNDLEFFEEKNGQLSFLDLIITKENP